VGKLYLLILAIILSPYALAQEPILDHLELDPTPAPVQKELEKPIELNDTRPILTGRVAEEQYLPPALYGTWLVSQTLISTNTPNIFRRKTSDIWILQQVDDKVSLSNPNTGAQTFVTVNTIKDNTATFSYSTTVKAKIHVEKPTITVKGDKFTGSNIYRIMSYKKKSLTGLAEGVFQISAHKISGPTLKIFDN
jgi:hypothetical protein